MRPMLQLPRLIFDFGAIDALAEEVRDLGVERPLLISDQGLVRAGILKRVRSVLDAGSVSHSVFDSVPENPTFDGVDRARKVYVADGCDCVVAVGGGSVIDTAKLVAATRDSKDTASFFEGGAKVGNVAPLIVVPTTAGTGSESSPDAGIHPTPTAVSVGISSDRVVPRIAICDPELTVTLPPRLTAATGIDALSHCIEGFFSTGVCPPAEAMALDGIARVRSHLADAVRDGNDKAARWQIMMAAFEGGAAISMGLGPAHAIAIGCGDQGLHHGVLSGLGLLASLPVLERHAAEKAQAIREAMELPPNARLASGVRDLMAGVGLPVTLSALGYRLDDLDKLAARCEASHFNLTSPYAPTKSEFAAMIGSILG
jgi:alcohol dehydrogenase class IV